MRRSPLKAKRDRPRRNEGRVSHTRLKPKTVEPTAEQARYHDWLRKRGKCEACGSPRDLVIHHILPSSHRDHWNVVLICAPCHNGRTDSVHLLGSERAFAERHKVSLPHIANLRLGEWRDVQSGAVREGEA